MKRRSTKQSIRQEAKLLVLTSSVLMCAMATSPASATVLILDANGNYIDAKSVQSGDTPYAAPGTSLSGDTNKMPLAEEGDPFPDPNAAVATDDARMENPASNYDIILRETKALASTGQTLSLDTVKIEGPETDINFALNDSAELETAETGGLVFATIVKPEPKDIELDMSEELASTGPVTLKAMPAFDAAPKDIEDTSIFSGPTEYDALIRAEVAKFDNVDFPFVKAVIAAESNYNITAISPKGAMGLMQIMPSTAETYGVINPFSPEENIRAGTAELSRLMTIYNNPTLALAGYNAGQGAVETHNGVPPFRETQEYIVRVLTKTFEARARLNAETTAATVDSVIEPESDPRSRPLSVQTYDW